MRRVIILAAASLGLSFGLAGCGSVSMDFLKPTPSNVTVRLESAPPGADARTSIGPGCKTPCAVSVQVPSTGNFSVAYTLDKYQPQTVAVQTSQVPGDFGNAATVVTDPNPVFAELQPAVPPKRAIKRPAKKRPPKAAPAAAPAQTDSAFPPPPAR
jgi:hypothetical protein